MPEPFRPYDLRDTPDEAISDGYVLYRGPSPLLDRVGATRSPRLRTSGATSCE